MMLYRYFCDEEFSDSWWCWFDETKDRVTGKWRIDEGDVVIEVAHSYFKGIFKKEIVEEKKWYASNEVKFVQEFCCER